MPRPPTDHEIADRLHSAAIHLLRRLRVQDQGAGLSPSRLSALSVVVFAGPITITDLAAAEQVRLPTISRLVKDLEAEGLIERVRDPADRRVQWLKATTRGQELLQEGRERRVALLATGLAQLSPEEREHLTAAAKILEQLQLPKGS